MIETMNNDLVKCTRCENMHLRSERDEVPAVEEGFVILVCPNCGEESFTYLKEEIIVTQKYLKSESLTNVVTEMEWDLTPKRE